MRSVAKKSSSRGYTGATIAPYRRLLARDPFRLRLLTMTTDSESPVESLPASEMTQLFSRYAAGDKVAGERLLPLVYDELKRVANNHIRRERADHTLQGTALVHEAYIRLQDQSALSFEDRVHFFRLASQIMRNVLVDHARAKLAKKRGGDVAVTSLDQTAIDYHAQCAQHLFVDMKSMDESLEVEREMIALDEAVEKLRELSPRQAQVVDLRFFGGLSLEDAAEVVNVSLATVKRDWTMARLFLKRELEASRALRA
jgi:RNA polymerase sigma-70 factor, ECF subfamily